MPGFEHLNSSLNAMEEVFRHIYGDALVDQMIAEIIEDHKASGKRPSWNELSLRLKPYRKFPE